MLRAPQDRFNGSSGAYRIFESLHVYSKWWALKGFLRHMYKYFEPDKGDENSRSLSKKRKRCDDEDQDSSTKKPKLENKMLMFDPEGKFSSSECFIFLKHGLSKGDSSDMQCTKLNLVQMRI